MGKLGYFALGAIVATVAWLRLKPANTATCCATLAKAERDKIAGYAGPLSGVVSGALDGIGLTDHLPSLLDSLGVTHG